ncbi:MAG: hypothetical protein OEM23_01505 [Gemmatimonadota bacterium]|nr:hypothetical protein [Gemmatimonadota bacterium]MDH3427087.1 hypothetical protein [Gemmatimonadota bacterium]
MLKPAIRSLWSSPALRVAAGYSFAGAAFAGAMLLLARALPKPEFGLLGLVVTILNLTSRTAPLGTDGIVIRNRMDPGPGLLGRLLITATVFGIVVTFFCWLIYELDLLVLALILIGTVAGAASFVAASQFQAYERFGLALFLDQGTNLVLLLAAAGALVFHMTEALIPIAMFTGGFCLTALLGWALLLRARESGPSSGAEFDWREAISFWGVAGGALFLHHLDRLMTPELLSFEALATFNVLAAVVGAPFHMLQLGVGFTLFPQLRREDDRAGRRRLIRREGAVTAIAYTGAASLLLVATPWIVRLFVGDKYVLPTSLIVAALFLGLVRLLSSYAKTIVKAIGTTADLVKLNVFSWFSIALAAGGAAVGATWGLEGLMYGIAIGWIGHSVAGFMLGAKHLTDRFDIRKEPIK